MAVLDFVLSLQFVVGGLVGVFLRPHLVKWVSMFKRG
jgi:hypothetical protein